MTSPMASHMWAPQANGMAAPMIATGMQPSMYAPISMMNPMQNQSAGSDVPPMAATVKLAPTKGSPETSSDLVIRRAAAKFNPKDSTILTVAEWTRQTVESNLEWSVKLARRFSSPGETMILFKYGANCETLVFLDDQINQKPTDYSKIRSISIGLTLASMNETGDDKKLATFGVIEPSDSIWGHLHYNSQSQSDDAKNPCLYIHTQVTLWENEAAKNRCVLQIETKSPRQPMVAQCVIENPGFEKIVLRNWLGSEDTSNTTAELEGETFIDFNARELILLEKALTDALLPEDFLMDINDVNYEDHVAAKEIIDRAHDEFRYYTSRKGMKKPAAPKAPKSPSKVTASDAKKAEVDTESEKDITVPEPDVPIDDEDMLSAPKVKRGRSTSKKPKKMAANKAEETVETAKEPVKGKSDSGDDDDDDSKSSSSSDIVRSAPSSEEEKPKTPEKKAPVKRVRPTKKSPPASSQSKSPDPKKRDRSESRSSKGKGKRSRKPTKK